MPDCLRLLVAAIRPGWRGTILSTAADLFAPLRANSILCSDDIDECASHTICGRPVNSSETLELDAAFVAHRDRVGLACVLSSGLPDVVEDILSIYFAQPGELDVLIAG